MSISLRRRFVRTFAALLPSSFSLAGLLCGLVLTVAAQAQVGQISRLDKQLNRVDLAVSGAGFFNSSSSGTNYVNQSITDVPGNTLGAVTQLRYTAKPYFGLEGTWGYARYTQKYSSIGGVQANADEYSLGYVVHFPFSVFGFRPFAAAGAGATAYKPTPLGGQGLKAQARATYYYDIGFDDQISPHFGVRGQFRQNFQLAPDFGQNYLTIKQRTTTSEPAAGVYLRF